MGTKRTFAVGLLALAANVNAAIIPAIVKLNDEGRNYIYAPRKISPGETIYFQFPSKDPACCKRSGWQSAKAIGPDPDAVDSHSDRKLYRYQLNAPIFASRLPFVGIAVIGKDITVTPADATHVKAVAGSEAAELALCTSAEGVHVMSQSAGKTKTDLYLYLGYDIENPTCEMQPAK